jgi:hypothetical protein
VTDCEFRDWILASHADLKNAYLGISLIIGGSFGEIGAIIDATNERRNLYEKREKLEKRGLEKKETIGFWAFLSDNYQK